VLRLAICCKYVFFKKNKKYSSKEEEEYSSRISARRCSKNVLAASRPNSIGS
jgi:hypothetical protein